MAYATDSLWQNIALPVALTAGLLIATVVVVRILMRRYGGQNAIRQALLLIEQGEKIDGSLTIAGEQGPETQGWNKLIKEHEQLRRSDLAERTTQTLTAHAQTFGDLESACNAMWQGLIVLDGQMKAKYANGAACVFLQAEHDDLLARPVSDFFQDQQLIDSIAAAIEGAEGKRRSFEIARRQQAETSNDPQAASPHEAGTLRISVRPLRQSDPDGAIIVIEDITQLRVAEQAQHTFIDQATHELRTPLTNVRLYVEILMDEQENDPALRAKAINVINQESRRLERIVGDMLSVAEIEAGSFQISRDDVRIETLIEQIQTDYEPQAAEKHLALTVNIAPKLSVVQGDRDKIMLALHNLVANAVKYTPDGGKVYINVDVERDQLVVQVKDSGLGISEDETEQIFHKFYRSTDKRIAKITGSGLGLALAREVIRLHGGDITVESQLDHGSTFTLTLPVDAQAA